MTFLRRIGEVFLLLDDRDVQQVLIRISEEGPIRTLDLQKKSGLKESTFYSILKDLEDAGLVQKKTYDNKTAVEYSITGLYNVCKIDKWLDGTYRGQHEADYFKNLVLRLKLQYEM